MKNYYDKDIEQTLNWLLSFMKKRDWQRRKDRIDAVIETRLEETHKPVNGFLSHALSVNDDRIAWYLYLAETALAGSAKYEPLQGARVLPLFKRLGKNLEQLKTIAGINKKVRKMINQDRAGADGVLFELLIALLWVMNGWQVEFIPTSSEKSPEFVAKRDNEEWFIECKRLSKSSAYSEKEREKWLKMFGHIKDILMFRNMFLEITFHEELETLSDTILLDELGARLNLVRYPTMVASNSIFDAQVKFIDCEPINFYLAHHDVKSYSPPLTKLLGGNNANGRGFSYGINASPAPQGKLTTAVVKHLENACGVFWSCDAEAAIQAKARDMRKHINEALEQLPEIPKSAIHLGVETLDGWQVEAARFNKILKVASEIDNLGKNLTYINIHLYQSYATDDDLWQMDESVYEYQRSGDNLIDPLVYKRSIKPWDLPASQFHWMHRDS